MEREFLISFAFVLFRYSVVCSLSWEAIFICSGSLRVCSGGRLWWSCSQGQPPWTQNGPQLITIRNSISLLCAAVERSKSDVDFCVSYIRSVFGIYSVRNLVSVPVVGVWVGNWVHLVVAGHCRLAESFSGVLRVSHSSVLSSFWVHSSLQSLFLYPQSLSLFITLSRLNMAPRRRGIPRRGSNSGFRGGQGGRGSLEPRRISPLAIAAPSSPTSDESGSLHSSRFKFKSRLNRPLISALVIVIFSEEEDDLASSVASSKDQSPSQNANTS